MITALFVYGTLTPGHSRWHVLEPFTDGEPVRDRIAGRLLDTGHGYPALLEDPAQVVEGWVVPLQADRVDAVLRRVDEIEGTDIGLYTRVEITTATGHRCWTYRYALDVSGMPDLRGVWPG